MATASPTPPAARVFISYQRNVEPDYNLATRGFQALQQQGHNVFTDSTLTVGNQRPAEIEARVRSSDYLIVMLTSASRHSETVKGEIRVVRDRASKRRGAPRMLPVRLAYMRRLPYPPNAWLDPIQYALWLGDAGSPQLIQERIAAISGPPRPPSTMTLNTVRSGSTCYRRLAESVAENLELPYERCSVVYWTVRFAELHAIRDEANTVLDLGPNIFASRKGVRKWRG